MKTAPRTAASSSAEPLKPAPPAPELRPDGPTADGSASEGASLDITLPTSWTELTPQQLEHVCRTFSTVERPSDYLKTLLLLRWNRLRPVSPRSSFLRSDDDVCALRRGTHIYNIRARDLAQAVAELDFLDTPPLLPLRPETLQGCRAVDASLRGDFPFGSYLALEALYQGFLQSRRPEALDRAARLLYPGLKAKLAPWEHYALLLWLAGLKNLLAATFTDLFSADAAAPATQGEAPDMHALCIAQLRALTGGDVTKMQRVREAETWDALEELNAKAREAQELKRSIKRK